jgi:flagellar motor switch protein FliM
VTARALVRLGQEGERSRRVCARLDGMARPLEAALRRALPFLVQRKLAVAAAPARVATYEDVMDALEAPRYVLSVAVGGGSGAIVLDGGAVATALDGVLGGGGKSTPARLDPAGLSPAQSALAARLARDLLSALNEPLSRVGTRLEVLSDTAAFHRGGLFAVVSLHLGEGGTAGKIVLLLPATCISVADVERAPSAPDPRATAAMAAVELDVVAELGRTQVSAARLAALKVGDVVRLGLPVDAPARVVAGGRMLFTGRPATRGGHLAIELADRAAR